MVLESQGAICEGMPKLVPFWTPQIPQTPWRSRQRAWGRPGTNWRKGKLGSTILTREKERCSNVSFQCKHSLWIKRQWSISAVPLSTTVRYSPTKQCSMTRLATQSHVLINKNVQELKRNWKMWKSEIIIKMFLTWNGTTGLVYFWASKLINLHLSWYIIRLGFECSTEVNRSSWETVGTCTAMHCTQLGQATLSIIIICLDTGL